MKKVFICTLSKCSPYFTICIRSQQAPDTSRDAEIARELSQAWTTENRKRGAENRKQGTEATKDNNQTKGLKVKDAAKKLAKKVAKITKDRKKSPKKKEATTKATVERKTQKEKTTMKVTKAKEEEAIKYANEGMF